MMGSRMIFRGKNLADGQQIDVRCENGLIAHVGPPTAKFPDHESEWLAPALFDLQINGAVGIAFSDPSLHMAGIQEVAKQCASHGIGGICPTLITNSRETLVHGFATLAKACEIDSWLNAFMPCYHLEGPYLSGQDGPRGAHSLEHIRNPNYHEFMEFQKAAAGRIRLVTLAPELPGAMGFIEKLVRDGVRVAIGHTAASPAIIRDAVKAGATLSTHLGNGSHAMWPRHENYFFEQLSNDELTASIISDGHHLPVALLKVILRTKPKNRLIMTSDASSLACLPPGVYKSWGKDLEVLPGGKVVLPGTPFLAGAGVLTDACVQFLLENRLLDLPSAIGVASSAPMNYLGLKAWKIEVGMPSNIMLVQSNASKAFKLCGTLVGERWFAPS